jgi:hypothetical protein
MVWAGYVAQSVPPGGIPTARWNQTSVDEWNTGTLEGLIVTNNAGGEIRLDQDSTSGVYTSTPFVAPFAFTAAAAEWEIELPSTTALTLEVRTSPNATEWREWQALPAGRSISNTAQLLGPIGVEADSLWVQYRISFQSSAQPAAPSVAGIEWLLLDSSAGPTLIDQPARTPAQASRPTLSRPPLVITRTGWGAAATAPNLTPSRPRRLELTALPLTSNTDPLAILRALQQVAISYGERDLPYAYIVDSSGNVYQGQTGFLASNGVIRVALLGEPTDAARVAAAQTLAWLAQSNSIPTTLNVTGAISSLQAEEIRAAADAATVRSRWTFVESNTRDYTERLMFFNPTNLPAKTVVTFLPGQSNTVRRELTVEPGQRVNFMVNEVFSDTADLPIEVTANQAIIAERTMLFANDALGEPGIEQFSRTWYFAEGDGSHGRATTLLLYNPQPTEVAADLLIIPSDGLTRTQSLVLPAFTSTAVELSADLPTTFGVRVAASAPIAAERTMLFGPTKGGGFLSRGANAPATSWYFAEGATIAPFSTTLALLNPGPTASAITTTFVTEQGSTFTRRYQIPGYSRITVDLRDIVPSPQGVGTLVTASQPIVAERTTYFNGGNSGTNTLGATSLAYTWRFAEGRTAAPATEFILLLNPNQRPAEVTLTIGKDDGSRQILSYTVPRTGRLAILLNNDAPDLQSHTTVVESNLPVVAERSIFIANDGGGGGHSALGTPEK